MLDLLALRLLLVELGLQLRGHSVVPLLCFFEIKSDLMNVSQCVEVLVLAENRLRLDIFAPLLMIVLDNTSLQVLVGPLQRLVLAEFIIDGSDQLFSHFAFLWKVGQIAFRFALIIIHLTFTLFIHLVAIISTAS